jgi:GAF domain-containing protein
MRGLRSLVTVHHTYGDPSSQQQARGLSWIAWGAIGIALLYFPSLLFITYTSAQVAQFILSTAFTILLLLGVVILINRGHLFAASLLYITLLFIAAVLILTRYIVNPFGANLLALSMPIVATGVLLNRRAVFVMLGVVVLTILGINVGNLLGVFSSLSIAAPSQAEELWLNAIYFLMDGVMLAVFAGGQRTLLQRNLMLAGTLRNTTTIAQTLAGATAVDNLLLQAVELIRDQFGYYHAQVFILEEATQLLVLRAATGLSYTAEDAGRRRISPDDPGVLNEVSRTGQAMLILANAPAARRSEFLSATRAEMLLPLIRSGKVLGVLDVQSINAHFEESEVEILQAIAAQMAAAIHSAQLYEALQEARRERDQIAEQLRELTREFEQLSREASGYGWARYLRSRADGTLGFDWQNGTATPNSNLTPALEQALSNAMPELKIQPDGRQILSVPIVLRGQVLGAMEFQSPPHKTWGNRSLELARVIAQRLALALDNIRLYEQAQSIADRERIANQVAARLQAKTDIDTLVDAAAQSFQQALGAIRTTIRLNLPEQPSGKKERV